MSRREKIVVGEVTMSFQEFILTAINRANSLCADESTSYMWGSHEAVLNDIWFSIPRSQKEKEQKDEWEKTMVEYPRKRGRSSDVEKENAIKRIEWKRQILSDVLFELNLLFEAGDIHKTAIYRKGQNNQE